MMDLGCSWKRASLLLCIILLTPVALLAATTAEVTPPAGQTAASTGDALPDVDLNEYLPTPLTQRAFSREMFSSRRGNLHPAVSLREFYTDNLFRLDKDTETDWVTVVTPAIRLAFPAIDRQSFQLGTFNIAPGGLEFSRFTPEQTRRYQAFAQYRVEVRRHKNFSEEDHERHFIEGQLQYKAPRGLQLEVADSYVDSADPYGTGVTADLDQYRSNLFAGRIGWDNGRKLRLRGEYGYYKLDYNNDRNSFRERADQSYVAYAYYRLGSKTQAFVEFDYIDVGYVSNSANDSEIYHYLAGLEWDVTNKSNGRVKVGYGQKKPGTEGLKVQDDFIVELQFDQRLSEKTSWYLRGARKFNETDVDLTGYRLTLNGQLGLAYRMTRKLTLSLDGYLLRDDYKGSKFTIGGKTDFRVDDYVGANASIGYRFADWITVSLGGSVNDRDSNFDEFDYTELTASLDVRLLY